MENVILNVNITIAIIFNSCLFSIQAVMDTFVWYEVEGYK